MLLSFTLIFMGYTVLQLICDCIAELARARSGSGRSDYDYGFYGLGMRGLSVVVYPFMLKLPLQDSILPQADRILLIATLSKFHLSAANPQYQAQPYSHRTP
ncbi:uncharacterized protein EAF01_010074 [Botrytis porri]|uniref:uncharacterized protein n=1 Tax=Botrytis porri TaxID=87229 RepID=UPI0019024F4B|nr:uncharacterized protein EAF01_010074 [Botrytis porri]KAF7894624.1 hypothetical protein EAF01_010074 [Botrytis porri]